ncbi:unnamed protein product [Cuscuta epithymum]|uniref:RING-type domain-containing protein n=1 Tax=Cuscuta epithymum TaxID=186058 RepID=A0AAV0CU75_9ASTE|nr:unnamed protein product [Cuscuta epithymum]
MRTRMKMTTVPWDCQKMIFARKLKSETWEGGADADKACTVCLSKGEMIIRLVQTCSHSFHKDCIVAWLRLNGTCPICLHRAVCDVDETVVTLPPPPPAFDIMSLMPHNWSLINSSNADWTSYPDSSRSTTGYAVFLGIYLISWRYKKQPTVSKSSTEGEYRAIIYTVQDTLFVQSLLVDMGVLISTLVQLHCDNVSATYLVVNPIRHDHNKHIKIDHHFVRERVAHGDLRVKYIRI